MICIKQAIIIVQSIVFISASTINVLLYSAIPTTKGRGQVQFGKLASMINEIMQKNKLDINVKFSTREEFSLFYDSARVS